MNRRSLVAIVSVSTVSALALTACGQAGQGGGSGSGDGPVQLTMWTHSAGNPAELEVYQQIIEDFNASQDEYEVVEESFPQGAYNDAIVAAAAATIASLYAPWGNDSSTTSYSSWDALKSSMICW